MPAADIIIPAYNPGSFLVPCLESCLAQTFQDVDLIVVDDASDEQLEPVLASLEGGDRIQYRRNANRLGIGGNWNAGVRAGQSQYVAVFHQDDVMAPKNLELKVAMLEANPDMAFVFSRAQIIDADGNDIGEVGPPDLFEDRVISSKEFIERFILPKENYVTCPSVIMRRSAFEEVGGFNTDLGFTLDMDMWMRLAKQGSVGYVEGPLVSHRRHQSQESSKFVNTNGMMEEFIVRRTAIREWISPAEQGTRMNDLCNLYVNRLRLMSIKPRAGLKAAWQAVCGIASIKPAALFEKDTLYMLVQMLRMNNRSQDER